MYALLAFRRTLVHTGGDSITETSFEFRAMGCFNGLNTTNAFRDQPANWDGDVVFHSNTQGQGVTKDRGFYLPHGPSDRVAQLTFARQRYTLGPWQCIAIGWIQDHYGQLSYDCPTSRPAPTNYTTSMSPFIGNILMHEGFQDYYYNGINGGQKRTKRVLTPNEQFLSNLFKFSQAEDFYGFSPYVQTLAQTKYPQQHSRLLNALNANKFCGNCAFQFVGSERPSGQAVCYLQTWRNTARYSHTGWPQKDSEFDLLVNVVRPALSTSESFIPILDMLTNHGSDSCITAMAGHNYVAYATKVGFWNTKNLYRCQDSMITEGRYNKGGQADAIKASLAGHIGRAQGYSSRMSELQMAFDWMLSMISQERSFAQMVTLGNLRRNATRVSAFANEVHAAVLRILGNQPKTHLTTWLGLARAMPDFQAPVTPPARSDGAAMGFVQWTSQLPETTH